MSPDLIAMADALFASARSGDQERLAAHYSPAFTAIRIERGAQVEEIAIEALSDTAGGEHGHEWSPASVADIDLLHTSVDDCLAMMVYRWTGFAVPTMIFTLVWDLREAPPLLVRVVAALPDD